MRHKLFVLIFAVSLVLSGIALTGCGSKEPEGRLPEDAPAQSQDQQSASGGGVEIHGAETGGIAPVTGTESLGQGGGGVQQAAKDKAKEAAGQASSGSLGQGNTGDESGE